MGKKKRERDAWKYLGKISLHERKILGKEVEGRVCGSSER